MVFPEYPRPHYTGLIGTGGITEAEISDTGGLMRMTFGSNAFFGYLKPAGQPVYWFDWLCHISGFYLLLLSSRRVPG
jgi:hypothetical protein